VRLHRRHGAVFAEAAGIELELRVLVEIVAFARKVAQQMSGHVRIARYRQGALSQIFGRGGFILSMGDIAQTLERVVVVGLFLQRSGEKTLRVVQPVEPQQDEAVGVEIIGVMRLDLQGLGGKA
jgi:hypothetical protein